MSYIFPSGTKRNILADSKDFDFEKGKEKDEGKIEEKTEEKKDIAEENKDAVVEDKDFAFDAIKDLPGLKDKATGILEEIKEKVEEVAQVIEEKADEAAVATKKVEEIAAVVGDKVEEKKEEKVEEKVEEVSKEEPTEVEIEIEDEKKDVSIPGVEEKPAEEVEIDIGKEVGPEDIVKKSKEACPECGKEVCSCTAKSKGEFIRLAKLSPKNREAVREYWLGLGFPKDYVDAMVRDY